MGKTKILEFNLGDMIQTKKGKRTLLIVEKELKYSPHLHEFYKYIYSALDLSDGEEYRIYTNCNNKHYKIVG